MNDVFAALGGTVWAVFFFVIALSVIVAIHEYGHYIVGRWTGIHAEVFSLGFGPVLASRTDKSGTKWQLAAIPFGGYVKFLGDADASSVRSSDSPGLSPEERRHTMAGAPLWARAATVAAGPTANFILTFLVLVAMTLILGIADGAPTVGRVVATPWQGEMPHPGDRILALNGNVTPDYESFSRVTTDLPHDPSVQWTVNRDGQDITFTGPHPMPALVGSVSVKSAAVAAGLQAGDVITRAAGRDIVTFSDLQDVVFNSDGQPVPLTVWRAGNTFDLTITPRRRDIPLAEGGFETKWLMGLTSGLVFDPATRRAGLGETISGAAFGMWDMTATTFSGLYHMIAGRISTCNMSGVIGMAETMGDAATAGPETFFTMIAILSLGIGILNLLPIPVLDGGHLVFHAYEAVTGRPPSDKVLRVMMAVGLTLLLSLMAFALLQDLICT
ncbi:MAG: RIP metalloprotease RseP [Paracoccaceae bacterium]